MTRRRYHDHIQGMSDNYLALRWIGGRSTRSEYAGGARRNSKSSHARAGLPSVNAPSSPDLAYREAARDSYIWRAEVERTVIQYVTIQRSRTQLDDGESLHIVRRITRRRVKTEPRRAGTGSKGKWKSYSNNSVMVHGKVIPRLLRWPVGLGTEPRARWLQRTSRQGPIQQVPQFGTRAIDCPKIFQVTIRRVETHQRGWRRRFNFRQGDLWLERGTRGVDTGWKFMQLERWRYDQ